MTLEAILKYPVVLLTGAVLALWLTRSWGPRALRWGFVDRPGGRKVHAAPVPTAGGIAVFLAFHAACAMVFLPPWQPFAGQVSIQGWYRLIPLSTGVVTLGLLDDRYALRPPVKLAGQVLIVVAAYLLDLRVQNVLGARLPATVDFLATLFWFLIVMNAFNLIDGIDGLAVGIALIASLGIGASLVFRGAPGDVLLFLGFAGACAGFLRYNFHPARVFLGDTGSLFLGFTLAALAISTRSKGPALAAIGVPMLAVGVPLFDTLLAVWRRSVRSLHPDADRSGWLRGLDRADAEHLHHRLLRTGGGRKHSEVALWLYAGTVVLAGMGVLVSVFHDRALGILAIAFLFGAYTVVRHLAWIELRDTGEVVLQGLARPVRRNRVLLFYLLADACILGGALFLVLYLMHRLPAAAPANLKAAWLRLAPLYVGIPFLCLLLFRSYSRVWSLARVSEYASTGLAVALGYALAFAIERLGGRPGGMAAGVQVLLLAGSAVPAVVGVRAALRVAQDMLSGLARGLRRNGDRGARTLLCGTGYRTTLFLRQMAFRSAHAPRLDIVGLVTADAAVCGHYVHGIRVLGRVDTLPRLLAEHHVTVVYLVEDMGADPERAIRQAVRGAGARLVRWEIVERDL